MNHFCTYCDQRYAARMLCLHTSLRDRDAAFRLHVLCFDAVTRDIIAAEDVPTLVAVSLDELLAADPEYAAVRSTRSLVESYFTATPVLVRYCLDRVPAAVEMTYLDADLYFFSAAADVLREQQEASVAIVPHRFPPRLATLRELGTYNVGWVSFRRDDSGLACLGWWRERCLEWCHDYPEAGRYADQGYLDQFGQRFTGVRSLDHPGINAAPWNVDEQPVELRGGRPHLGGAPVFFFHFQGVREVMPGWFDPGLRSYGVKLSPPLREMIFRPYLEKLVVVQERLRHRFGVVPTLGYARLAAGSSWRDRWHRFAVQRLLPWHRRLRGQLIHCASQSPTAETPGGLRS